MVDEIRVYDEDNNIVLAISVVEKGVDDNTMATCTSIIYYYL